MRSRLTQRLESKTKKNLILSVIGIIIILFILLKFGVPFLATVSYMLAGSKNDGQISKKTAYLAPPTLNDTYDATNSATVAINGTSISSTNVVLYVNGQRMDETQTDDKNSFTFDTVRLKSGSNAIKAQAVSDTDQKSDFSNTLSIIYLNKPPELSLDNPTDGAEFHKDEKSVEIKGKTDPGVRVTINDFWAIVDTDGNYSYTLSLKDGDNDIKVVATDTAGNTVDKSIKVTYSQ